MSYRYDDLAPGEIYHVFSRGVEKRKIFLDKADYRRFCALLVHCLPVGVVQSFSLAVRRNVLPQLTARGEGLVDVLCYCLMPNHFHVLLRQNTESGTSIYMQRLLTSYSRYFNTRYERSGSLFIHPFKAVLVEQDQQLLHVARYIHLNPYVSHLTEDPFLYKWSSLQEYLSEPDWQHSRCHRQLITAMLPAAQHQSFIRNQADYARSLSDIQHQLIDFDD